MCFLTSFRDTPWPEYQKRPVDHPVRWVDDPVEHGLVLTAFFDDYAVARGAPPYDPRLMLTVELRVPLCVNLC